MKSDPHYWPTDWDSPCEAKCRKTGKRCPHRCTTQIPNTIAAHNVMDGKQFLVSGRPARLCDGHARSWRVRAKRLLSLPLIDSGHLSPYNAHGCGSVIICADRIDFSGQPKIRVPKNWGVIGASGNVPAGLLEKLPVYRVNEGRKAV